MRHHLLLALLLFPCLATADDYGSARVDEVTSIYDGDTFRANIEGWPATIGERMPVRVHGADTPEMRGECPEEKRLARQAKQFTVAALRGADVIELHHMARRKYFRIEAVVMVDGKDLASALIGAGLARPYDGGKRNSWCNRQL